MIKSPVDGIVLSRNVDVGQTVSAGLQAPTLFVIARSLDTLELAASVAESDVGRVLPEQPVTFTVDAYPQQDFTGTVRQVRLQPTVAQNVVSYTTIIDVPNPGGRLKPGMTATLSIEVERMDDVLRVPASAVRFRPSEEVLMAFNGSTELPGMGNFSPRGNGTPRGPRMETDAAPSGNAAGNAPPGNASDGRGAFAGRRPGCRARRIRRGPRRVRRRRRAWRLCGRPAAGRRRGPGGARRDTAEWSGTGHGVAARRRTGSAGARARRALRRHIGGDSRRTARRRARRSSPA